MGSLDDEIKMKIAEEISNDINAQVLRAIMLEYQYPYRYHDIDETVEISEWAEQIIGSRTVNWDYAHGTYYFKKQTDLEFFMLKWL